MVCALALNLSLLAILAVLVSRWYFQMSQTATSSKLCSSASLKKDGTSALIIRSPAPTIATRTRPFAPITRSGRRMLRLASPAPATAADVVRIKSLRVVLLMISPFLAHGGGSGEWGVGKTLFPTPHSLLPTPHSPLFQIPVEPFPDRRIILLDSQPECVRGVGLNY